MAPVPSSRTRMCHQITKFKARERGSTGTLTSCNHSVRVISGILFDD